MSNNIEIVQTLANKKLNQTVLTSQAEWLERKIVSDLNVSLSIMTCYAENPVYVDVDIWNRSLGSFANAENLIPDDDYYFYIKDYPSGIFLKVARPQLFDLMCDPCFYWRYAAFSKDLSGYIIEDDSGIVIGKGCFEKLVLIAKESVDKSE